MFVCISDECKIKEMGYKGVKWSHVAQYRDQWWTLVYRVMYLWVLYKGVEIFEHLRECYFLKKNSATCNSLVKIIIAYF
jgi:hypothetical protein